MSVNKHCNLTLNLKIFVYVNDTKQYLLTKYLIKKQII